MAARWTDEQQKAIDLRHSNILVSAAAGSGKTAVLVERIFSMLTDLRHPLNIDNLLVVTFTNAAAAEMKERVEERLSKSLQEDPGNEHIARQLASIHSAQIMTIHSFCLYVIRNHFNEIDLDPAFRIGEETELKLLRGDVVQTLLEKRYENGDADFLDFVECFAKGKLDAGIEDLILSVYEYSRSYPSPKLWLRGCLDSFSAEDVQALDRLEAVQFLYADVRRQIKELQRTLREALALCTEPDGPVFYEDMLAQDLKTVDALEACRSYDDYFHVLAGLSFAPLSRKKMPDASETKKTQVKNMRAFVKDTLTALRDDFFPTDGGRAAAALRRMASPMAVLVSLVEEFSQLYQEAKEARNMVDFGDLEHFALKILTRYEDGRWLPTDAAVELSDQYEEILIDEYQDSNQVQETILGSISRERLGHPNMFMVGDVKQSIYKFRLAKPELFMEKYKTYPKRDERYQRIELHKNFRSRDTVIDTVNFLFRQLMAADLGDIDYDDDAALYPGAEFKVPDDLSVTWADTSEVLLVTPGDELAGKIAEDRDDTLPGGRTAAAEKAEAAGKAVTAGEAAAAEAEGQTAMTERELEAHGIALRIRELVEGPSPLQIVDKERQEFRPVTYGDIVILLRTMSGWADTFVRVLNEENIPAQAETVTGFFSALEIQTMLSMLSVIDNPRQDIALAAVLKSPAAGLDDEQLAMIASVFGHPREHPHTLYDCCRAFLADGNGLVLEQYYSKEQLADVQEKLAEFFSLLERFRDAVPYTPVHELILRVCEETGYYAYVSAMPGGAARRANLDMLVEKAVDYEKTSYHGLFNFIRYIDKLKAYEVDFGEAAAAAGPAGTVRILSIHKSKGLEYPVVFAAGLGKAFNQQDARSALLIHSDFGFGPDVIDTGRRIKAPSLLKKILARKTILENLGEELRVLYVALTRAREKLILCGYVKDMDKALERWSASGGDHMVLPFSCRQSARCFMDWIMAVLARHQSAHGLLAAYGRQSPVFGRFYEIPVPVIVKVLSGSQILSQMAQKSMGFQIGQETLRRWDASRVYVPQMHQQMDHYLDWVYPYAGPYRLRTKMTVSEIKTLAQMADGAETAAEDSLFILPDESRAAGFLSDGTDREDTALQKTQECVPLRERMARAALRGTTVHKILEKMDIASIQSMKDVFEFIEQLCACGQIEREGAALVYVPGIYSFARSGLAGRMARAAQDGGLFREKQFVIGVPYKAVEPESGSDDMLLIQGIIDAWFIEAGQAVIVDYKTDYVPDDGTGLVEKYKAQLDYYAMALEQMTGIPVKEKIIYSFGLGREILVQ